MFWVIFKIANMIIDAATHQGAGGRASILAWDQHTICVKPLRKFWEWGGYGVVYVNLIHAMMPLNVIIENIHFE